MTSYRNEQREDKKNNQKRGYRVASISTASRIQAIFDSIKKFNSEMPDTINISILPDGSVKIKMVGSIHKIPVGEESLDQRLIQAFKILQTSAFAPKENN